MDVPASRRHNGRSDIDFSVVSTHNKWLSHLLPDAASAATLQRDFFYKL
jgi:hypothetical protein